MTTIDGFKRIAGDVTNLCELQLQLLSLDGKVAASRAISAVVTFVMALVISLAAITSLLFAGAWGLHEYCNLKLSLCLLLSGGFGLLVAVVLYAIGYQFAKQASTGMAETRSELAANVRWLKSVLTSNVESKPDNNQSATSSNHSSRSSGQANGFKSLHTVPEPRF